MTSERGSNPQLNRQARAKPGEPIVSGNAPREPGEYEVLTALTVEGVPVGNGDGADPSRNFALDPIWGGPIGSGGRKVVEKKEWSRRPIGDLEEDTDYVDCKQHDYTASGSGVSRAWGDRIPQRVRFFNLVVSKVTADYWAYINHGLYEPGTRKGGTNGLFLAIDGLTFDGCRIKGAGLEMKASVYLVRNPVVLPSTQMGQLGRKRHGRQSIWIGGDAAGNEIAFRGWCDVCDVKDAVFVGWGGPLPYRSVDWTKLHNGTSSPWAGKAWEGEEGLYIGPRVKSGTLSKPSGGQETKFPALDCIVHPEAAGRVKALAGTKNLLTEAIADYRTLWSRYGFGED